MKSFLKSVKRQEGFTLVELMVVVAIIGLLSAVAIPNFKKYQAKSKVTEAKLQLSAIYTAESAFFSDYNMYAGCLSYMGYNPAGEIASRYFATGFGSASLIDATARDSAIASGLNTAAAGGCDVTAAAGAVADSSMFAAGKGIGSAIATTILGNPAGAAAAAGCDGTPNITAGTCVGTQAGPLTMEWQAAAVGYVSADHIASIAAAAGLTINEKKIISNVVQGY